MNSNRWLQAVLVISLGLNILFVGVVLGRALGGPPPAAGKPIHLGMVMRHLDAPTREALRPQLLKLREEMLPLRKDMQRAQLKFRRLLMADNIDESALEEAQAQLAGASSALQSKMHEHMALTLKAVPPEQRQRVLQRLERRHDREDRRKARFHETSDGEPPPEP